MYRQDLDALKGIAIIAVVLFHIGLLKSGYLGVDAFFVINGFLVIPSMVRKINDGTFNYFGFMEKRIIRLLPLIVVASAVALGLGYFLMLPDHYENLAQSVIASCGMSENILSAITTKNYWDVVNDYKPLMHLWYVGILFEFYLVMPLVLTVVNKVSKLLRKDEQKGMFLSLVFLALISLMLFLNPDVTTGDRFYYLPYRLFELLLGGIIALSINKLNGGGYLCTLQKVATPLLIAVIFCSLYSIANGDFGAPAVVIGAKATSATGMPLSGTIALLLTVVLTCLVVACKNGGSLFLKSRVLAWIGSMSYSIFIWHQVLLAFYRYSISDNTDAMFTLWFLPLVILISIPSYYFIEKKIKASRHSFIIWCVCAIMMMVPSGYLFLHAGVVRDVPELDVVKGQEHRGMFGEYCDRVYSYKSDFNEGNGRVNVIVEGVSFGRDFANVLLESTYKDSINLSYIFKWADGDYSGLVKKADLIFTFKPRNDIPEYVWKNIKDETCIYGIGTKTFGACNGQIYRHRNADDYFEKVAHPISGYKELNDEWHRQWGDNYIDFMLPVTNDSGMIKVFTEDKHYISQDGQHLTPAGARYYASKLSLNKILNKYVKLQTN